MRLSLLKFQLPPTVSIELPDSGGGTADQGLTEFLKKLFCFSGEEGWWFFIINVFSKANLKLRFKTESLCVVNVTCLCVACVAWRFCREHYLAAQSPRGFSALARSAFTLLCVPNQNCHATQVHAGPQYWWKKKKKNMAKLNRTIKVPYSGFEWFRAGSSQSIKIGTHLPIDKLIKIGKSDQFIDIDCIDQSVEIDDTLISFTDLPKFYRFHRYIPEDTSGLLFIQKWKLISCKPVNLFTIELQLRVEGSNNLLSLLKKRF